MNIKTLKQNFGIGNNRFVSRHPNASVIYFLIDRVGNILYVGETEERRWDLRRQEHIRHGKVFYKMLVCQTGKFKSDVLMIEKGLILMANPPLNKEKSYWKPKYMDAARSFLRSIEGDKENIKIVKDVEYIDRRIEVEVLKEIPVEVIKETFVHSKDSKSQFDLDVEFLLYSKVQTLGVFGQGLMLCVYLLICFNLSDWSFLFFLFTLLSFMLFYTFHRIMVNASMISASLDGCSTHKDNPDKRYIVRDYIMTRLSGTVIAKAIEKKNKELGREPHKSSVRLAKYFDKNHSF